ncbi:YbgA family protein [candidate division KSB1 bacterium]
MKPNIVVSKCLEFEACRYNGQRIPDGFIRRIAPYVNFIKVCPELEIGLGAPREPVRLVKKSDRISLVQLTTERDVTADMNAFTEQFLGNLENIDGFILKYRSPSCGMREVKLYPGTHKVQPSGKGSGLFGGEVIKRYQYLAVEDEARLNNPRISEHFLTKLFLRVRFRHVKNSGKMKDLVAFHSAGKFLLMAYNKKELTMLGRIVANPDKRSFAEVISDYEEHLSNAFVKAPRYTSMINTFQHALGYFKKYLSSEEKTHFLRMLDNYRSGIMPASALISLLRSWIIRFKTEYLAMQTFFVPFPEILMNTITDRPLEKDYWK